MTTNSLRCTVCQHPFPNLGAVEKHQSAAGPCREETGRQSRVLAAQYASQWACHYEGSESDEHAGEEDYYAEGWAAAAADDLDAAVAADELMEREIYPSPRPPAPTDPRRPLGYASSDAEANPVHDLPPEPVIDEVQYSRQYEGAGHVYYSTSPPLDAGYAKWSDTSSYGPFASKLDFEFAKWAKTNFVSEGAITRLLQIDGLAERLDLSYKDARSLNQIVDDLPSVASFMHAEVTADAQAQPFDLYYRDVMQLVRELMGDPTFRDHLHTIPEQHFADERGNNQHYTEFFTGNWVWETQMLLPDGATVIPIIISSDKTQLSLFTGDHSAYPVYITIGNIAKHVRRQPSKRAHKLLAYLPTLKIDGLVSKQRATRLRAQLFHTCMKKIFEPLFQYASHGVMVEDSYGDGRHCFPLLATYVADYPEQCLVTCVRAGRTCPKCATAVEEFDEDFVRDVRDQHAALRKIWAAQKRTTAAEQERDLKAAGLNDIPDPFWAAWPHSNIFTALGPDVLHQLIQGIGKHLVSWLSELANDKELDARFARLPCAHGLRHFDHGISVLSRVSGTEHKAIYSQLLGCVAGLVPSGALRAARALLDFIYMAQYQCHSESTLQQMDEALSEFHRYKEVFIAHGLDKEIFKFPKLHMCQHYAESIRLFGTTDNCNTEATERLHIDLAKDAFKATNRREYIAQMCTWLERREAVFRFATFIASRRNERYDARLKPIKDTPHTAVMLAKRPPLPKISITDLERRFCVKSFRDAMATFLVKWHNLPTYRGWATQLPDDLEMAVRRIDWVNVWHRVRFFTPNLQGVHDPDVLDIAHAAPINHTGKAKKHGRFDTVLVETHGDGVAGIGGLEGVRVARLRAIFNVPKTLQDDLFGSTQPGVLGYVEWFSAPSARPDPDCGMHRITRCFDRTGQPEVGIIEIIDLRRSCHLVPCFGTANVTKKLNPYTILDHYHEFYLNNRVDKDAFRSMYF